MEVEVVLLHVVLVPLLCPFVLVLFRVSLSVLEAVAFGDRIQRLRTESCLLALDACAFHGSCWHLDKNTAVGVLSGIS